MDLLLIRHAIATDDAPDGDAARPLTPRGVAHGRQVVAGLALLGLQVDRVYHSPLLRAVETAALLAPINLGPTLPLDALAEPPGRALLQALEGERVALIGHQPHLAELAGLLLTGDSSGFFAVDWRKAGVAWLVGEPVYGGMMLRAFLPPRVLRRARA